MDKNKALELFAKADALYRQGQYRESLAALNGMAAVFPDNKALLYAMALCFERLDRQEEALRLCDRLIREFHFDKAVILKARLVTTPDDAEKQAVKEDMRVVWPENLGIDTQRITQTVVDVPAKDTRANWYFVVSAGGIGLLVLFVLAVKYFAQADTVVPGAAPTLFPVRLLVFFLLTVFAGVTIIIYCNSKILKQHTSMRFITCLCCGILFLAPFPGWLVMLWVMHKRLHIEFRSIIFILLFSVGFCLSAVWLGAYALDLTDLQRIYMELKAGYW